MFRTTRGLNRPSPFISPIPEYPIPAELEKVLDVDVKTKLCRKSEMFSNILQIIEPLKHVELSESHYVQLLKLALYLEEYHSNENVKKRKMIKIIKQLSVIESDDILYLIPVKEFFEERVYISEGDFVDVTDTITNKSYMLRVIKVMQTDIVARDDDSRLSQIYVSTNLYSINFRFQNYPLRCAHYALWLTYNENVITYLFPHNCKSFINMENQTYEEVSMLNPNIESNPEQKQAVLNIMNKSSFPAPYILYGPPGTGKTATVVEAICQIHKASSSNRILVCTPSNTAADDFAKRLLKFIESCHLYRIYTQFKNESTVDKELRHCSYYGGEDRVPLRREDIAGKAILISTLCAAMRFVLMKLSPDYFSHIIIDEAGQGTEADILIPISIASKDGKLHSQILLAGDPQQLGPTVISEISNKILGRSTLERIMSYDTYKKNHRNKYNPKYITKLLHNYRSHPRIINISNKLFYDNELIPKFSIDDKSKIFPVIFHGIEGIEKKYSYSLSKYNDEEIAVVLRYVYDLINNKTEFGKVSAKDIGIVTPFKLQSNRIKKILQDKDDEEKRELENGKDSQSKINNDNSNIKCKNLKDINVGTVELFQGQERKIIIMTAVRSKTFFYDGKRQIGFLANQKRFNVAMTRAQNVLIVIGNPGILQKEAIWQYILKYCIENGSYRGSNFALRTTWNEQSIVSRIQTTKSLFKEQSLKLFPLDGLDLTSNNVSKTIGLLIKPEKDELPKEQVQKRLHESLMDCSLNGKLYYPFYILLFIYAFFILWKQF